MCVLICSSQLEITDNGHIIKVAFVLIYDFSIFDSILILYIVYIRYNHNYLLFDIHKK